MSIQLGKDTPVAKAMPQAGSGVWSCSMWALELCVNFLLPLLRAQFATNRKVLPAMGTPPRDGLRHEFSFSQSVASSLFN
jgi:hypothetical protein